MTAATSSSTPSTTGTCAPNRFSAGSPCTVAPGETVALVGASGSGKSTVSLLLPRFYDVQHGSIRIDGIDVRDVTLDSLRRDVGVVFEDAFLFSDSVRSNIAYGRPDATDADVERGRAGRRRRTSSSRALPDGYDTDRRRTRASPSRAANANAIAIARAMITDPRILVLDDATSSIDATTEEQIHATLREIMEHRTTILIAHRRSTLRLADRVVRRRRRARAVEEGTHDELMADLGAVPRRCSPVRATIEGADDDADSIEDSVADGRDTGATARPPAGRSW